MMSSIPPKPEGRRRPVSVLALKLWELSEQLDERLDSPADVLEMLVTLAAKGENVADVWAKLHAAAAVFGKSADLALAYEQVTHDLRIKLLAQEQQAFIFLQAAQFFADVQGDIEAGVVYAERATAIVPGHQESFQVLEGLLTRAGKQTRLAEIYAESAGLQTDPEQALALLYRGLNLALSAEVSSEFVIELGNRILRLNPADGGVRDEVMRRLLVGGRHQDVVDLLEQALGSTPPPTPEEAALYREQLVDLCFSVLRNPERALTHVEGLLENDPGHPMAQSAAEQLLHNPELMLRAAAALSDAFEKIGDQTRAVPMLELELEHVRGPRRVEVQRRLAILRQDALGDPVGALELLGPVVAGDPGNDELRQRFVSLNLTLNQPEQAARLLSRALTTHRDPSVRARVGLDVGRVYLALGDTKRGQAALQKVFEANADDRATLAAAQALGELYLAGGDNAALAVVLDAQVRLEPEREARQAAARQLVQLSDEGGAAPDAGRAVAGLRALVGSPWTDDALARLEALYTSAKDDLGLSDVLAFRAERAPDPEEARELGVRALELRTSGVRDSQAVIQAYQSFAQQFGPSREVHARLAALLEQTGRFEELVEVLLSDIDLAGSDEQVSLWFRVAELRLSRLSDTDGALEALTWAVALDPEDAPSRAALESLLQSAPTRLRAAAILEPLYRRQKLKSGLLRVLEARVGAEPDLAVRLAAAEEAVRIAEESPEEQGRAFAVAGKALIDALDVAPEHVNSWLVTIERLTLSSGNLAARAHVLSAALAERPIDSEVRFRVGSELGAALAAIGDLPGAVQAYRRALSYNPGSRELVHAIDELLAKQGTPEERLALYETALAQEADPVRRRDFLNLMARLQRFDRSDLPAAIRTLSRATADYPSDVVLHEAYLDALAESGDHEALAKELERVLPELTGDRRSIALLRLAEAAERSGDHAGSLGRYRELLSLSELSTDVLGNIERLALEQSDGATLATVLERQLAVASDDPSRAQLLERLGNAHSWQRGDVRTAARFWLEGAHLANVSPGEEERARRLYDRVLEAEPSHAEAAQRLVELSARAGDFVRVSEAFSVVLESTIDDTLESLLLTLEDPSIANGSIPEYVELIDRSLGRKLAPKSERRLQFAKARALSTLPNGSATARVLLRELLQTAEGDGIEERQAFEVFIANVPPSAERSSDRRLLHAFRVSRAADPAALLFDWARVEAEELGDEPAAIALYRKVIEQNPDRHEAYLELARLEARSGDGSEALATLRALAARGTEEVRSNAELTLAELLVEPLARPAEALAALDPLLVANPSDRRALKVAHRLLAFPMTRERAAELLERAAQAFEDPARKADVIEALLAVSADSPEISELRGRWLSQLLESRADDPEAALNLSLRGAESAPSELELWRFAEQMARKLEKPQPVAEAYARVFERGVRPELADELGRSMVEFYEEWFDQPERVVSLLERVLALCPTAGWAFDRLKLAFNAGGRWQELFSLYDARLSAPIEPDLQIELLREAAMAARDFAEDPERAMTYLEALNHESPGDTHVEASLERLYERYARKRPLISLLSARLPGLPEPERPELKGRIASLWLDLEEPEPAFALAEELFASIDSVADAVRLLERLITLPFQPDAASEGVVPPLLRATAKLKAHYGSTGSVADVVRMLEIEERAAGSVAERRSLLEQIVRLRLKELKDVAGAFETIAELVLLDPENAGYRKHLADLGKRVGAEPRRADVLVSAAQRARVSVRTGLLNEAASVCRHALGDEQRAIELYREVLREAEVPVPVQLTAAREIALLLRPAGEALERVNVLERLADLEEEPELRRAALGEAAALSFEKLSDPARAIVSYRKRIADDPRDLEAMDGLCRALEASSVWEELIDALEIRAAIQTTDAAKEDRIRAAKLHEEVRGDRATAIEAWRRVVTLHGGDAQSFQALSSLLTAEERFHELSELIAAEIQATHDFERQRQLLLELGGLHEARTFDWMKALEAYVAAGDWQSAVRVASLAGNDPANGRLVTGRLLELAVSAWQALGDSAESPAAVAADWAIGDLCRMLLAEGLYAEVVEYLLRGSELPLPVRRRRELMREAGCLASDKLGDAERAIELFQSLLDEDGADDIAISCVTRLALLLEEKGRFDVIATLWENQAIARALAGDPAAAQMLWARAGEISEQRLGDLDRALGAYERGAEIGGEACLEALARVFGAAGSIDQVARALERLCAVSSSDLLADRALRLAEAYVSLNKRTRAREALEQAVPRVPSAASLRKKLAVLYRDAEDFAALAALFEDEAGRASSPSEALGLLREAAELHLERRRQPAPAVPLLERAIAIDPDAPALRLRLAQALYAGERFADSAAVLRDQLARYGTRRPKDRALVHYELARVLLATSDRAGALGELDSASRIDPAHPKILHMLARTAREQGEHERAERMFRALLLVAPKEGDTDAPSKSEALIALGEIARARGDTGRFEEFVSSAFEAAQQNPREARTLEQALRGRDKPELVARALALRLSQGLAPKEALRCLADLCELHDGVLGDLVSVRGGLVAKARSLEDELLRRESADDEAWRALGRCYAALGEALAEARVLERRVEASARSSRPPPSPDLYLRLAVVRLADPNERDQGLDLLDRALELGVDPSQVESVLRGVFPEGDEPPRVLDFFEKGARAKADRPGLLRVLVRRVALGDASMAAVREGVALAEELGEAELCERLLTGAISLATAESVPADCAWLRLELAKRQREAGEVAKALILEEQAAPYLGTEAARELLLSIARDALSLGDVDRAARLYAELLRDDPENRDIFEPLLDLYRQTDQTERLVELLEETAPLVTTAEERSRLRLEQAELLLDKLGRKHEATLLLREIVREDPKERRAHARLFELLDAEGREDELIELFDSEIDAQRERGDGEAASALSLRLVSWLERHGRGREARIACQSALEHDPGRRELLDALLRVAEASEDDSEVADALEKLLEIEQGPEAASLCRRLLAIRERDGDARGEERALELGFAKCPGDPVFCDRLAELYGKLGEVERVADVFERARAERPHDRSLAERHIEAYRALGRHDRALSVLESLPTREPNDAFLRRTRGAILTDLGRHAEAVEELEIAANSDPSLFGELIATLERAIDRATPEEQAKLGDKLVAALERSGDAAAARARLLELLERAPNSRELLLRLAELDARSGNDDAAIASYSRLIDVLDGPELVSAALALAELSERTEQATKARVALERAREAAPENAEVRARLVAVLEADGAYRSLAELLREEAQRETRRDERAKKLLRVGELLLLPDGDLEQALEILESVRVDLKDSIDVVVLLARAYGYNGRLDNALQILDACIEAHRGKRVRALGAVYEQKADVHLEEGFLSDGLSALAKAFEMDPKNARLGMRVARLAIESEEADIAQRALRAVAIMKTAPLDGPDGARSETKAEANFTLAELAQRAGDPRKARVLAAKALSENPDHEKARALLKTLDTR